MTSSQVLNKSCVLVIVVASVERFAYKGVSSNLVTYLTGGNVRMSSSAAAKAVSGWNGISSMLPLISSILVDAYWDRYSTITFFSLLYIGGLAGLTLWALLDKWMPIYTLFLPLYLISIGQSGYNPSLQAFGADQLEHEESILCCKEEEKGMKKSSFFHWWYIGICIGSLLGNSTMSYIQDNFGWGIGFSIPMIAMTISVAFFSSCSHFYVHGEKGVERKQLGDVLKLAKESILKLIPPKISLPSPNNELAELELQEKGIQNHYDGSETLCLLPSKKSTGIANVILKILPIWIMLLMFAVIFQQPATFFTSQGMVMKHSIGRSIVIPPAMLQSAITISIVMLMPLYDKLIIPLSRLITRDDKGITVLQRIGIGMFLSIVAMVVAALVETKRLEISREGPLEEPSSMIKQMSIFWLLPQYILLGVSDIFTVVGMQEFFYSSVPKTMRTVGIGLYLSVFGVGSFISALLISIVEIITGSFGKEYNWFSSNMSEAKLYKYYWFLALLASLSLLMFAFLCKNYVDESTADVATDNVK